MHLWPFVECKPIHLHANNVLKLPTISLVLPHSHFRCAIALTVFMPSLNCLALKMLAMTLYGWLFFLHPKISSLFVCLQSIDAYKMISLEIQWEFDSTLGLKFNFPIIRAFVQQRVFFFLPAPAMALIQPKNSVKFHQKASLKQKDQKTEWKYIISSNYTFALQMERISAFEKRTLDSAPNSQLRIGCRHLQSHTSFQMIQCVGSF